MRPGVLAVRTANEYRARDLIGYLTLRHLFRASSARSDRWAREVAVDLTASRTTLPYRSNRVYKGVRPQSGQKTIEYRQLHLPGPTEMLAEAALLDACGRAGGDFARHPSVFSNVLSEDGSRHGMVDQYFVWWKQRQLEMASVARASPAGRVIYFDVRKFYDSISYALAKQVWSSSCDRSRLPPKWRELGEKLLSDYQAVKETQVGLLVGPMFAHVLGNLVLRSLDLSLSAAFPRRYFRYVDDIAVVASAETVDEVRDAILRALPAGLKLHEEKTLELECPAWVQLTESFPREAGTFFWGRLVGGIKYFLAAHSKQVPDLERLLAENGFRLPLRDYRRSLTELPFVERLVARYRGRFESGQTFPVSPNEVLDLALTARAELQRRFNRLATEEPQVGMRRKFQVQRLRYVATRLLYLASPRELGKIREAIESTVELSDVSAIYGALVTSDVSALLSFSSSVAQSAGQLLELSPTPMQCRVKSWRAELQSAWSVLSVAGVRFALESMVPTTTPLIEFATQRRDVPRMTVS